MGGGARARRVTTIRRYSFKSLQGPGTPGPGVSHKRDFPGNLCGRSRAPPLPHDCLRLRRRGGIYAARKVPVKCRVWDIAGDTAAG